MVKTTKKKAKRPDRYPYRGKIVRVRRTEIVEFGWLRGDVVNVRFFDEVTRIRKDEKGERLIEVFIEDSGESLDVRKLLEPGADKLPGGQGYAALILAAGQAVRGLSNAVPRDDWEA